LLRAGYGTGRSEGLFHANGERAGLYVRFITNMHHAGGLLWYNNSKLKLLNSSVVATARFSSNAK